MKKAKTHLYLDLDYEPICGKAKKSLSKFVMVARIQDTTCKVCRATYNRLRHAGLQEKRRAQGRRFQAAHPYNTRDVMGRVIHEET